MDISALPNTISNFAKSVNFQLLTRFVLATSVIALIPVTALADSNDNEPMIRIEGNGWGHGVGMSQYGAYGRALAGQSASEIISFYYPNTQLEPSNDVPDDLTVHIFSGEGAIFTTSGSVDLLDSDGSIFATVQDPTNLTVGRSGSAITISLGDGTDLCIEEAQPENIQHCGTSPISIELVEGEPVETEVINQFTNIGTSGHSYQWGKLVIRERDLSGGGIFVLIEDLPMDKYLYGLAEVPPTWPEAALQAQAIAGRTYANARVVSRRGSNSWTIPWDLYSTVNDQHYTGFSNESGAQAEHWKNAVDATSSEVILSNGSPINAYYGSSNGGYSESGAYVFCSASNHPCSPISYLVAVEDEYDYVDNPRYSWTRTFSGEDLGRWLADSSLGSIGTVTGLNIGNDLGASKRTDQADITIFGNSGSVTTKGDTFMAIVNAGVTADGDGYESQILSTLFSVDDFFSDINEINQDTSGFLPSGWRGSESTDEFGSVIQHGDFNGDGSNDIAIGVPGESVGSLSGAGLVHLVLGGSGGWQNTYSMYQGDDWVPGFTEAGDGFGSALTVGDFNNDGFDDLVVGAPGESIGSRNNAGLVMAAYGSSSGLTNPENFYQNTPGVRGGSETGDLFGAALAAGDINGDGYDDLVVGVPGEGIGSRDDAGGINVLFGSAAGLTADGDQFFGQNTSGVRGGSEPGDLFGSSLAIGDIDGDGYDDLVVGVPGEGIGSRNNAGLVHVLYGSAAGLTADGDGLYHQNSSGWPGVSESGDLFGSSVDVADIDGDGVGDLIVGVPGEGIGSIGDAGLVQIRYNPGGHSATAASVQSLHQGKEEVEGYAEAGDGFGTFVLAADVTGDDTPDLLVGTPEKSIGNNDSAGLVSLFPTIDGSLSVATDQLFYVDQDEFSGTAQTGAQFGISITTLNEDIIIGAPGRTVSGYYNAGAIYYLNR